MKFYKVGVAVDAEFDIVVEAENELDAADLARDEAKKRVRSPECLTITTFTPRESDEK